MFMRFDVFFYEAFAEEEGALRACLPANMIVLAVDEVLNRPAELAEIKLTDGACEALIVLFEKKPF